jgi:flagellar motor protein MotB
LAGGCCPTQADLDKAWALNRNCRDELKKWQDRARLAESEQTRLQGELDNSTRALAAKDTLIGNLNASLAQYKKDLDAAKAELIAMGGKPGPLPPILDKALRDWAEKNSDIVELQGNMVKFKADMTFDPGSADIKPAALAALKKLAEILNSPDANPFNVFVAGHTDDIPLVNAATIAKFEDNWGLSLGRAKSVVKALYGGGAGIAQERMGAMGFSKYHPVAPNAPGNKGNVLNRRVEIWIVPNNLLISQPARGAPAPRTTGKTGPEVGD